MLGDLGREEREEAAPERLAKGDIVETAGLHVLIPPIQKLRDQGKLDHHRGTNEAMFQAAEKLQRHFIGCGVGVKAQDLNKVVCSSSGYLEGEEAWGPPSRPVPHRLQAHGLVGPQSAARRRADRGGSRLRRGDGLRGRADTHRIGAERAGDLGRDGPVARRGAVHAGGALAVSVKALASIALVAVVIWFGAPAT